MILHRLSLHSHFFLSPRIRTRIFLFISISGGLVTAGMGIYDTMQYIKCDVSTICVGMAASMGAFLLAGERRKENDSSHAEVMIHQPSEERRGRLQRFKSRQSGFYAPRKTWRKSYRRIVISLLKKLWRIRNGIGLMTAEQALEYGLVDHIFEKRSKNEELKEKK